ncbi:MAG: magnesium/cobalt transporter CorA [Ignavibacteria bacterium]|nr:magnesium/cobalt transporter CorA [Ignavibacteria bacterium]
MIKIIKYNPEKGTIEINPEEFKQWDENTSENLWIDIHQPEIEESKKILSGIFNFHDLAIEDALKYLERDYFHFPKIDDYERYLFIVFNGILLDKPSLKFGIFSLSCFIGKNYIITIHNEKSEISLADKFSQNKHNYLKKGPDYLLHLILDELVDRYYPLLDIFESEINKAEEKIFKSPPSNSTLFQILNMKKELLRLRRIAGYQKEVLFKLSRSDYELISKEESLYYRNVFDHLLRISETTESYRDIISGMLDSYLSLVNNRMNDIIKVLTIIATIILPLNLITGVYGMNFQYMPLLHHPLGFYISIIIMFIVIITMLIWFKKKKWLSSFQDRT